MDGLVQNLGVGLFEETVSELTGRSHRKWAVALVAFVAGVAVAVYLRRRRRHPAPPPPAEGAAA